MSRQTNQEPGFFMALKDIGPDERAKRLERLELLPAKLPPPPIYRPAKTRSP